MSGKALNRALVLEEVLRTPDDAGGYVESWRALGTLWAQVAPRTGRELAGLDVTVSRVAYRITVRGAPIGAPSRPKAGQRFREQDRLFHIRAVTEADAEGRYLTCFAEEEVAA